MQDDDDRIEFGSDDRLQEGAAEWIQAGADVTAVAITAWGAFRNRGGGPPTPPSASAGGDPSPHIELPPGVDLGDD